MTRTSQSASTGSRRHTSLPMAAVPMQLVRASGCPSTKPLADRSSGLLSRESVTVDLDQPFVADPEVMRDLVPDDVAHLVREHAHVRAVMPEKWPAVDRDLVRKRRVVERRAVAGAPPREGDALIEPEIVRPGRGLVFDGDLDICDLPSKLGRECIDCLLNELLEVGLVERSAALGERRWHSPIMPVASRSPLAAR